MIAMAVKNKNIDSAIAPLFGKAKYFAIINNSQEPLDIEFIENGAQSGTEAIELLISNQVSTILMSHMGEKPFSIALARDLAIYYVGSERLTIKEALNKLNNNEFKLAKDIDTNLFFKHGKHAHHENNH